MLTAAPSIGSESKQVLLCGQRKTDGKLILAQNGAPQPNLYTPLALPAFENGTDATNYLLNFGLRTTMGVSFTLDLPIPNAVTVVNSQTKITWSSIPNGFAQLIDFALDGILSQDATNGTVVSAQIISGVATMIIQGDVAYNTTDPMVLSGLNNIQYPDPDFSDPIAQMVWDFYQTRLSAATPTEGYPSAILSIVSDRDSTITANPASITLITPDSVVQSGGNATLTFEYTGADIEELTNSTDTILDALGINTALKQYYISNLTNFGYLPKTAYGNTSITQTGGVSGTFDGYEIYPTDDGGTVVISVKNVTGTYTTSAAVAASIDNTINVFSFLDQVDLYGAVQQWPITTKEQVTTTYADFFNGVAELNLPDQVLNNHFFTYGCAGNISTLPTQAANLPNINTQLDIFVTYPYVYKFGDIPYENAAGNIAGARITSAVLYMLANGDAPSPSLGGSVIKHLPVSSVASTTSYSSKRNGTGDIAVSRGWMPLAPNSDGVVTILQSNTSLTTIPGTTVSDPEFRYTHIWDTVRWVKREVAQDYLSICNLPNNAGSQFISPKFIRQFDTAIKGTLVDGEEIGYLKNVGKYSKLVQVKQDPLNANQVDAYVPTQPIAQLNGANVLINVFSALYNSFNSGGQ
jgi:hypothetical protein